MVPLEEKTNRKQVCRDKSKWRDINYKADTEKHWKTKDFLWVAVLVC